MNNLKSIQEQIVSMVCNAIEKQTGGWECGMLLAGEPKMPVELVLEGAE